MLRESTRNRNPLTYTPKNLLKTVNWKSMYIHYVQGKKKNKEEKYINDINTKNKTSKKKKQKIPDMTL